jgi:plasmid stability protein
MTALHVRDLDATVYEQLKALAAAHHRSLTGEVKAILAAAVRQAPLPQDEPLRVELLPPEQARPLRLRTVNSPYQGTWSRDDIYRDDELRG